MTFYVFSLGCKVNSYESRAVSQQLISLGLFPLGLLEAVLAVVHDLADRGLGAGGDFHQVEVLFIGDVQSRRGGHDAQLGAVIPDEADFLITDLLIDLIPLAPAE